MRVYVAHVTVKSQMLRRDRGQDNLGECPAAEEDRCAGGFRSVAAQGQIQLLRRNYGVQSNVTALLTSSMANVPSFCRSLAGTGKGTAFS